MRRIVRMLALAAALVLAFPAAAFAMSPTQGASAARVAVDAIALAVAIALLLDVLALRRVAEGSMFGENLVLVLVAVICLSASVLAGWVQLFMPTFDAEQVAFTRDLLILASMIVMGVYFFGVRRAMMRFVRAYPGADDMAPAAGTAPEETVSSEDG
ncbi:MAG: hypothetical protein FDZ70_10275 [Actinobacteria bacterium]|nr:MAG: hypothetical protein FDZ70_10275 [Actinomycetota bacterium]